MDDTRLVIRYGGNGGRMVLKLDELFPRTKGWLIDFERKVLRYCPDREEVVDQMLQYIQHVTIPGLPAKERKLDEDISAAYQEVHQHPPKSTAREAAEWYLKQLKNRKRQWPKYCEAYRMNVEVMDSWRRV